MNSSLHNAVLAALTVLGLSTQITAFAVGLGDINIKSYLGQPLLATVEVQGLSDVKDLDCFRLGTDAGNVNAINQANLKLGKLQKDSAILTITTNDVILEPITSLTIVTECGGRLSRSYALLVDPATVENAEKPDEFLQANKPQLNNDSDENITSYDEDVQSSTVSNNALSPAQSKSKSKLNNRSKKNTLITQTSDSNSDVARSKNIKKAIKLTDKQLTKTVKATLQSEQKTETGRNLSDKQNSARLTISPFAQSKTSDVSSLSQENSDRSSLIRPNLYLEKSLNLKSNITTQSLANKTDYLDEATVLSNRLAHLEKQISVLQLRNASLEADKQARTVSASTLTNNMPNPMFKWWPYLLGASVLIGAYFAASWWRRRDDLKQTNDADEVWANLQSSSNNTGQIGAKLEEDLFDFDTQQDSISQDSVSSDKNTIEKLDDFEHSRLDATQMHIIDNNEHDILDHVDVFLSHGRTQLAIQLLQNHLLEFPKQSVAIWLLLLELQAKENLPEDYKQSSLECKEHYNIRIAEFTNDEASEKQSFEDFGRLVDGLQQIWGSNAAVLFCDDLIYNTRLESRVGFDKNVLEEIILLRNIAQETLISAEVIQLGEKKIMIKERKDAQIAANKQTKLVKMDELFLTLTPTETTTDEVAADLKPQEFFEFDLVEYK